MATNPNTALKPITLYGVGGPNPPKIAILLNELSIPYTAIPIPLSDVKSPSYTAINPNGRLPAIHDPNTNLTLWESGAIILYLLSTYDPTHLLSFPPSTPESHLATQYLFFQVSGQGPYYGQAAWFKNFHHEQLPSATERYVNEVNRVTGVLERVLAEEKRKFPGVEGGPWLVGGRYSFADLAFVSWQTIVEKVLSKGEYDSEEYPEVKGWIGRMLEREAVREGLGSGKKLE
ncbi:glutathione S-transferase Ure2-like protein [Cercophora newfieldiana]|uniref:Glutathione S-transferase Ure2-like protein n=1 Tax=Cercophora newfieldiana TaxID=92897 RepID=A0AA40CRE6_9PEZI|nr:glutathione S-transferase Ure2-like protein [Cercophora newfieldiana]